jgi:hypothetical protein
MTRIWSLFVALMREGERREGEAQSGRANNNDGTSGLALRVTPPRRTLNGASAASFFPRLRSLGLRAWGVPGDGSAWPWPLGGGVSRCMGVCGVWVQRASVSRTGETQVTLSVNLSGLHHLTTFAPPLQLSSCLAVLEIFPHLLVSLTPLVYCGPVTSLPFLLLLGCVPVVFNLANN